MQAIIFDFGNVIGFFDHYRALEKIRRFTRQTPAEMHRAIYDGDLEDAYESGRMTNADFLNQAKRLGGIDCSNDILEPLVNDIFWPNPEVCELIPLLAARYPLILGSNTNALHSKKFLVQFENILGQFQHLVLSFEIGVRKPKRAFFEACQQKAGVPANSCLFVDDLANNIAGAEAAGLKGLLYRPQQNLAGQLRSLGFSW